MKEYKKAELEIIMLESADIICTSGKEGPETEMPDINIFS